MSCKKCFPKNFSKFTEITVRQSLSNTVKILQAMKLATLLKKDSVLGVSELGVCRSSRK